MSERTLAHDASPFRARMGVPGDKSLSHRALIFAAMAAGESEITGRGPGRDIAATEAALRSLGVEIRGDRVASPGAEAWRDPGGPIDAANSGTTLRLLAGALAARPFRSTLTGDASLQRRPMRRLLEPLWALGAEVGTSQDGTPPVTVRSPDSGLRGTSVRVALASAQVRSAFALAAVQADGVSRLDGPPGFRDHTERWLAAFGLGIPESDTAFRIDPGPVPPAAYPVPGDPSSAAFLWAAAALVPGAETTVTGVCLNPGRTGFLDVLEVMGAGVEVEVTGDVHGDPVGTVRVAGRGLGGVTVSGSLAVRALDELPLVAVLGGAASGTTVIRDAAELRAKESDRIATTVAMIRGLGGDARAEDDGLVVEGGRYRGGPVESAGDHRIAMAAAVAATVAAAPVVVVDAGAAGVSWPGFYDEMERLWASR